MGKLVRLLGSGIGLAQEAIAAHKESKAAKLDSQQSLPLPTNAGESSRSASARASSSAPHDEAPPEYVELPDEKADALIQAGKAVPVEGPDHKSRDEDEDDLVSEEGDEEVWELDDAVDAQLSHTPSEEEPTGDANALVDEFIRNHQPPPYTETPIGKLPCAVIIPQRRPRDKKRGFVRAYAPVLSDCGIDQATFLSFLKTFYAASKSSPYLQVINIAAMIGGMVPSPIAMGVGIAVQVAVGVAMEVQSRSRTNTFLDRMNNEFFKPHGLYCLILTFKPESSTTHASVDITQAIHSSMTPRESGMKNTLKNLRLSDGKTYGELELPEAAPLIFPALESLVDPSNAGDEQKSNRLKSTGKFFAGYADRRAQARYAAENPGSTLATGPEEKKFAGRYADPNHPANSGSLISLLTGGKINTQAWRDRKRASKRIGRAYRRGQEITPQMLQGKRREGIIRKMLKKDVLYMMIVNLPTEEEMAAGKESVRNEQVSP